MLYKKWYLASFMLFVTACVCIAPQLFGVDKNAAESNVRVTLADLAETKQWQELKLALTHRSEVNAAQAGGIQADGMTALHWAVKHGHHDSISSLLAAGANPSVATHYKVTPLAIACSQGDEASVRLLLDGKADVTALGQGKETLLMLASRQGNEIVVKMLIDASCELDATDKNGQTALMWAAAAGQRSVVWRLINAGANQDVTLKSGFNAFFFAVRQGYIETVDCFLDAGTDVHSLMEVQSGGGRNALNKTPAIVLAVESGHFELALRLIERGANPNDQRNGYSPLHVLSWVRKPKSGDGFDGDPPPRGSGKVNSLAFVRRMVSMGANPNLAIENGKAPGKAQLNLKGATPLLLASKTADLPLMKLLIELGADPLQPNADNCTPLLAAAGVGTVAVDEEPGTEPEVLAAVDYLLSIRADLHSVDKNGETAMHGAAYRAFPLVVKYLKDRGLKSETWNHKNRHGWSPFDISDGKRPGSVKPNPAVRKALEAAI
jgi:ankyrin repeat protein